MPCIDMTTDQDSLQDEPSASPILCPSRILVPQKKKVEDSVAFAFNQGSLPEGWPQQLPKKSHMVSSL